MAKKVIIVTGPIGSGKSTAIEHLSNKGYPTLDLDKISNEIINSKESIKFLDNEITMKFEKGTKVTDIIENVILFSEYGQSIGKTIENNKYKSLNAIQSKIATNTKLSKPESDVPEETEATSS